MTRALTGAVLAELTAKSVRAALLVELNTDAGAVRVWSGIGDLVFGGNTFIGVGHLGSIGPVQESGQEVRANAITLQLSGIPSSLISTALTTQYQGRAAKVWLAFFDARVNPYALSFDGVGNYVSMGDVHDFAGTVPFTVECFINLKTNPAVGVYRTPISKTTAAIDGYQLVHTNNLLYFERGLAGGRTQIYLINTPVLGSYYPVAVSYDGTSLRGYVSGVQVGAPVASSEVLPDRTEPLLFGKLASNFFFDGLLDEVRIWNVARTQTQIQENMYRRLIGNESGLVGYWRMDEGSGTQARDATANANHGTITGALWTPDTAPLAGDLAFATAGLIADPVPLFNGRMDVMHIEDGPETATITVTAESRLADLTRPRVRRYTDIDQQQLYPGDLGLQYVAALANSEIHWGSGSH